jgi:integrase
VGYYALFVWDGRRYCRAAGPTKKAARDKLAKAHALLEGGIVIGDVLADVFGDLGGSRQTFTDIVPRYLEYASTRKKASTLAADRRRLDGILKAAWTSKYLVRVRTEDLLPWIAERQKPHKVKRWKKKRGLHGKVCREQVEVTVPGASGPTVNRDLALISTIYKWAIRAGYAHENPVRRVERFSEKGRAREVYLSADEARALVRSASESLRPLLATALATGMRKGELLSLRWRSVDLRRSEIVVEPETAKSGRSRVIPLTGDLAELLRAQRRAQTVSRIDGSDAVFTLDDGSPMSEGALRGAFARALKRCEAIPTTKRQRVCFHTLRHYADRRIMPTRHLAPSGNCNSARDLVVDHAA